MRNRRYRRVLFAAIAVGGIAMAISAVWLALRPIMEVDAIARAVAGSWPDGVYVGTAHEARAAGIESLGGEARATEMIAAYLRAPRCVAPRKRAALFLLASCKQPAVDILSGYLDDPDDRIRAQAAESLGEIGPSVGAKAAQCLMTHAKHDTSVVRLSLLLAIGKVGDGAPDVEEYLRDKLRESDVKVRATAAYALAELPPRSGDTATALAGALGDSNEEVQEAAVCGLRAMGAAARNAVPMLLGELQDSNVYRRFRAIRAMECTGVEGEVAVQGIGCALRDSDPGIRAAAVRILGRCATGSLPENVKNVLSAAVHDTNAEVRLAAIEAMRRVSGDDSGYVMDLILELRNERSPVREEVVVLLGQAGATAYGALADLRALAGAPGPLQQAAATAIAKIAAPR